MKKESDSNDFVDETKKVGVVEQEGEIRHNGSGSDVNNIQVIDTVAGVGKDSGFGSIQNDQMKALVTYGSVYHSKFTVLNISDLEENVVLNVGDEPDSIQKHDSPSKKELEKESKKYKKRQEHVIPVFPMQPKPETNTA